MSEPTERTENAVMTWLREFVENADKHHVVSANANATLADCDEKMTARYVKNKMAEWTKR
jgi:hypothetical protein